ncbi:hypothetical protein BJF92_14655 [Rhizobium rhizosphaerae]|uniref:Uncharacterized protein n=1 Tax=Xaviernesmea rhizosphaerae TaxID=1672749 RepID=A0A1Q9ACL9_9HYPH|nr:hypothetical protein [Xaviernesmea rhizosphaerae]OLP52651.1 hypothetical protein BJF92_14655 [Xaviernesmea rhizosphaerae]OQP84647.1 hypothetical protein BTR14_18655 [Xaviernesmea rhizosphaerae]
MNKIVREHYPASKLPEDLREGLPEGAMVRIVIDEVPDAASSDEAPSTRENLERIGKIQGSRFAVLDRIASPQSAPRNAEDTLEAIRRHHASGAESVSVEEAVRRIRALRDEWDDE